MTPQEIRTRLDAFTKSVGARAEAGISIDVGDWREKGPSFVVAMLYPFGLTNSKGHLRVTSDSFDGALDKIEAEWVKYSAEHKAQTVRSMALAIIRLTTELGECTDAALRAEFDAGSVAAWGDEACAMADTMASKGPFSIKRKRGANAA